MLAGFTRSITLMDTASRVENDLAEALRAMAAQDGGEAAARRLGLAKGAARAAQEAVRASERLHEQARRWVEHAEVAALAETGVAETQPQGKPVVDTADGPALVGPSRHQRLAGIDRRLTELRQARLEPPGGDTAPQAVGQARRRTREADRHSQQSAALSRQARQLAEQAFRRAASAHDRAADANDRSARAGIGDVAEHKRLAAFHRAAAKADRQRAQEVQSQVADPEPSD